MVPFAARAPFTVYVSPTSLEFGGADHDGSEFIPKTVRPTANVTPKDNRR